MCFFLTSPFIELLGTWPSRVGDSKYLFSRRRGYIVGRLKFQIKHGGALAHYRATRLSDSATVKKTKDKERTHVAIEIIRQKIKDSTKLWA